MMEKNNIPIFGIITAILLVVRILLDSNSQLVIAVASINLVALLLVVYSITDQIRTQVTNKIEKSGVPRDIMERERQQVCRNVYCCAYIPLAIIYVIYLAYFSSQLGNDIISIVALGLSLSDTFVANTIANLYRE